MGAREYLAIIRKRWALVVVCGLLGVAATAALSLSATPMYRSTATLYFSLQFGDSANDLNQGSAYTQNQMQSFAELATRAVVLEPVIEDLGLATSPRGLAGSLSAVTPQGTVLLELSATSESAQRSADVANAVVLELGRAVEELSPRGEDGQAAVRATVIAPADPAASPFSPRTERNVAAGLLGGLLLGSVLAIVRSLLDTRVREAEDVRSFTDVPVIGTIGRHPRGASSGVVMQTEPTSPLGEHYRQVRTNLRFLAVDSKALSLVVTSTMPGRKSTTACNLALALAESDLKVLLIDADLRRPSVGRYLELEEAAGLTTVLIGRATLDDVVQPVGGGTLDVLAAGELPPNPGELLASRAMEQVLTDATSRYDVVILDSAPVSLVADASILAPLVAGTVVVADTSQVRQQPLADSLGALSQAGGRIVGIVLNRVADKVSSAYSDYALPQPAADGSRPAAWRGRRSRRRSS
ncbi:polysaccharide biosynthesis tyrosine autokinase [Cellulomonas sp. ATA003]|uniref:polysaccharide biosynthesis tyrosine autokinase n=1 Tax=Cellulomonas sp. ATA003 TaxID=3073064 RepID=UPI00287336E6|nr:polysaccharide biosynthesis tyrosine autokinase [Cellulomonas sp. ATA003]WNB85070.1 polysaccharide biosynthesis tyrosine autokinase [Cellulomonas sp. ATA003]